MDRDNLGLRDLNDNIVYSTNFVAGSTNVAELNCGGRRLNAIQFRHLHVQSNKVEGILFAQLDSVHAQPRATPASRLY